MDVISSPHCSYSCWMPEHHGTAFGKYKSPPSMLFSARLWTNHRSEDLIDTSIAEGKAASSDLFIGMNRMPLDMALPSHSLILADQKQWNPVWIREKWDPRMHVLPIIRIALLPNRGSVLWLLPPGCYPSLHDGYKAWNILWGVNRLHLSFSISAPGAWGNRDP